MQDKYHAFLHIASLLNQKLNVVPLLYGSLGLERVLGQDLDTDDIDLLIDPYWLNVGWVQFQKVLVEQGYHLVDEHEHEFVGDSITVAFANISTLPSFAGVDPTTLPIIDCDDVRFMELNAEQYLAVYQASQQDGYRQEKRGKKDAIKIRLIQSFLNLS